MLESERSRKLDGEIDAYVQAGYRLVAGSSSTAQLIKPKTFSFIWALFWFLFFGFGVIVYLIWYAAK
jgi:hypothetical protein